MKEDIGENVNCLGDKYNVDMLMMLWISTVLLYIMTFPARLARGHKW